MIDDRAPASADGFFGPKSVLTVGAARVRLCGMHPGRRSAVRRAATAWVAAFALALQALLATWPTKWPTEASTNGPTDALTSAAAAPSSRSKDHAEHHAEASGDAAGHAGHAHASHAADGGDAADPPRPDGGHHRLCCILGGKLGTAIAPAPSLAALVHPITTAAAAPVRLYALSHRLVRPPLRPLGARAPPVTG